LLNDLIPADNTPCPWTRLSPGPGRSWRGRKRSSNNDCWRKLPRTAPVIKLEDISDGEWYRPSPSPPRRDDPCQGSSRWEHPGQSSSQQASATPPKDDGEDGDDDYTAFYRHFDM
jgi:hypothetical protein